MKKLTALLALLLCAALLMPCAIAQEGYVPGAAASQLVTDAWNSGAILQGDAKIRLELNGAALGLSSEEQQLFDMLKSLLDSVTLNFGAGRLDDGLRIELGAELAHAQGGMPVSVEAAANVDLYGISLESDLIEGRRVTARWETLLAMAGMNDTDIQLFLLLRDMDWATILPEMLSMAEEYVMMALEMLAPYGDTIAAWAAALPVDIQNIVVAEGYPTASQVLTITVTQKDVGNLITQLATQLKADPTLSLIIDLLLQEGYTGLGEAPTAAQMCNELIAEAAQMDNTDRPVQLKIAVDENFTPIYVQIIELMNKSTSASISTLIAMTNSNVNTLIEVVAVENEAGNYDYSFQFANRFLNQISPGTPAERVTVSGEIGEDVLTVHCGVYEYGEQIMGLEYALDMKAAEGALPGMTIGQSMNMVVDDGYDTVQMIMNGHSNCAMTADDGEVIDNTMTMDMYVDGQSVTTTSLETVSLFPAENGFTGSYSTSMSMPAAGMNVCGMDVMLSCEPYDPAATAALSEIAFETSSSADIEALLNTLMNAGQLKLLAAMQALPTEVLNLLISQ